MRTIKRFSVVTLFALSAAFMLAACQSRESDQAIQQKAAVKQNIQSSIDDIDNQMENLRSSLQSPEAQPPASNNRNNTAVSDKQSVIKDQLADLEDYRDKFTEKLNEIETVKSDEWADFQKDVNDLQNDYRQSLQDYASEISGEHNDGMMDRDGASDADGSRMGTGTGTGTSGGTGTGSSGTGTEGGM